MRVRVLVSLVLVWIATGAAAQTGSGSQRVWRVGYSGTIQTPPTVSLDVYGKPQGFMIDLIKEMAGEVGVDVVFVAQPGNSDEVARKAMERGEIDLWAHARFNVGFDRPSAFAVGPPAIVSPGVVVTRREQLAISHLEDLRTLRVGCVADGPTSQWVERQSLEQLSKFETLADAIRAVDAGEVDAVISSILPAAAWIERTNLESRLKCQVLQNDGFARVVTFGYRPGDPVLARQVDEAFKKVMSRGRLSSLHEHYIARLNDVTHSDVLPSTNGEIPRRSLISRLRVGVEMGILPEQVVREGADGKPEGFAIDLIREIGRVYGVPCEFVVANAYELRTMLQEGRLDLVAIDLAGVESSFPSETTRPYLSLKGALFLPDAATPPRTIAELQSLRLAASAGSPSQLYLQSMRVANIVPSHGVDHAVRLVKDGTVDGAVGPLVLLRTLDQAGLLEGVKPAELPGRGYTIDCGLGVNDGNYSLLWDLEDAYAHLQRTGFIDRTHDKWLGSIMPREVEPLLTGRLLWWFLGTTAVVLLAGISWQWSLRRELERRTSLIREAENRFRQLFDGSLAAILLVRPSDGRVLESNPHAATLLGVARETLVGSDVGTHLPLGRDVFNKAATTGRGDEYGVRVTTRAGEEHWLDLACSCVRMSGEQLVLVVCHDVTIKTQAERTERELERRLRESQQLESIGRLAGGVAHDFNNILLAIMGNASLARSGVREANPETLAYLDTISLAAQSGSELTRQLLTYAGKAVSSPEQTDLSALAQSVHRVMGVVVAKNCTLVLELGDALPPILADRAQVAQLLMNLMTNAAEATGDPAKAVVLRTGMCAPARATARPDKPRADGVWVYLEVEDHGCGMSEDVRAKMFEPFFSTKRAGRGLGLSTAMGTVKSHGGTVEVETAPGAGTRVRVSFPALAGARKPEVIREPKPAAGGTGEGTRVLVVDDESLVLNVTRELLTRTGHSVSTAPSGEAALTILESSPVAFDVALIDLRMPGIGGLETMRRARRINPGLPVVIVSGNVFDAPSEATLPEGVVLLPKPFTVQQLTAAIGQAVGSGRAINS